MTIDQLIEHLQAIRAEHGGELPVVVKAATGYDVEFFTEDIASTGPDVINMTKNRYGEWDEKDDGQLVVSIW